MYAKYDEKINKEVAKAAKKFDFTVLPAGSLTALFFASFSTIPAVGAEFVFVQANRFDHIVEPVVAQGCEL